MSIKEIISSSVEIKKLILADNYLLNNIELISNEAVQTFKRDGKLLFCGNGGSAADAQHLAAEFSGRFGFDRDPLFAEALHVNSSYMTA
ncbi:MAG: SIS domain-containing protein, partial [Bacteroidota bacterium]|nr:SIS domain-containing protein [Bacteroidota bacterium]